MEDKKLTSESTLEDMIGETQPPTETMKEFMELDSEFKEMKKKHESLRKSVIQDFNDNPGLEFEGISRSITQRIDFQHLEFYNWVKESFPEFLEELRDERIDYDKFESLEARGEIEYDELPEHVYKITKINTVRVKKRK